MCFLKHKFSEKIAVKTICAINIAFSCIFLFIFICSIFIKINLTYLMISILIISGILDTKFESKYSLLLNKKTALKKGLEVRNIAYSSDTPVYKLWAEIKTKKLTNFYIVYTDKKIKIINQFYLEKIMINANSNDKIGDILLFND